MITHCSVCGRKMEKTQGPIGPVCLRKKNGHFKKSKANTKAQLEYLKKHEIFAD